jgi:biofilm PGA synthesis lipoprotein PgaB
VRILHILPLLVCSTTNAGVVLLYHHVDTKTPPITSISPAQFEKHLQILEEEGFTVLPLSELRQRSMDASTDGARKERIVAITFDDAYLSIYKNALPMLKARNWPFTVFVATEPVETGQPFYMSWNQLRELTEHGGEIANHTHTHTHLLRLEAGENEEAWLARIKWEITTASELLSKHGFESTDFAYTYGEYNAALLQLVTDLGLTGYGQQSGAIGPGSNPALLPRFPLSGVYVGEAAFRDKIRSLAMPIEFPTVEPLVTDTFKPELHLKFENAKVNPSRLTCYGPGGLMPLSEISDAHIIATALKDVPIGRSRYNCTLPSELRGRFYWFSQLWIRREDSGEWYEEP